MPTPILLLNCGSSSMKYQVIDAETHESHASGLVERIGQASGELKHRHGDEETVREGWFPNHTVAFGAVVAAFEEFGPGLQGVVAVGHRVVHGGDRFREAVRIDADVIAELKRLSQLAPLHNPPALAGIRAAMDLLPEIPHVGIFDTAFFTTLPPEAYTYAIDQELAKEHGIRKYGFHGTSHAYVSEKAADYLGRQGDPDLKVIVCHLGNGASISAVHGGTAVETSMGLTPLQGLVMGTRSGDVDPGLHKFLSSHGMTPDEVDTLLNKQSGMLGLCGYTDMRDVGAQIEAGNEAAILARDVYVHRLVFYIGAYMALLGGLDALVFTAGVGENAAHIRGPVVERLAGMGLTLDPAANEVRSREAREISTPDSAVKVLVIPTNEELAMARQTVEIIGR
ncbi:Acetate kinase [Tessaracoccus sp. O5.2]|uniref:acetate/propionate family kinase n=1 Tax=Tessaracoccus sp. O5.2 TaxID=3157622 RepID=UPI0035EF4CE3